MADTLPTAAANVIAAANTAQRAIDEMRAAMQGLRSAEQAAWAVSGRDGNKTINGYSGTQRIAHMATVLAAIPVDVTPPAGVTDDFTGFIAAAWTPYL
jgi:CHASE3 domain sensor protein